MWRPPSASISDRRAHVNDSDYVHNHMPGGWPHITCKTVAATTDSALASDERTDARRAGPRASVRNRARGANARSTGAGASARTSAEGANVTSAGARTSALTCQRRGCGGQGGRGRDHLPAPAPEEHMQGLRGDKPLPEPAPKEQMQGVRGRGHLPAGNSDEAAHAKSAARKRTRGCQTGWRIKVLMARSRVKETSKGKTKNYRH